MITVYKNGAEFLSENREYLETDKYMSAFFFLDAPLLTVPDSRNYAMKAENGAASLLIMKVEPYSALLFGDADLSGALLEAIFSGGYELGRILGSEELCGSFFSVCAEKYGVRYTEALAMDFMEASEITEPSCPDICVPDETDLDELVDCLTHFITDCGLEDELSRDSVRRNLPDYRMLRADGRIASLARISRDTDTSLKIVEVYTRPEYRGRGYARRVVNTAKNEILAQKPFAVLNVDKKNPISNHLYSSLGFRRVFSRGEYRPV